MASQEGSKALGECPSLLVQGTPMCLAPKWVSLLGTSCLWGWWLMTRFGAGWLCAWCFVMSLCFPT